MVPRITWRSTSHLSVAGLYAIKPHRAGHFYVRAHTTMTIYFAHRSRQRMKVIGIIVAIYFAIVAVLTWLLPEKSATYSEAFLRWFVAIPLFFVAWFTLEWLGTKLLSLPFWQRMPSIVRVTLLVVCIVVVIIAAIITVQLVHEQNAL